MKSNTFKRIIPIILTLPLTAMAANEVTNSGELFGSSAEVTDYMNAVPMPLPRISASEVLLTKTASPSPIRGKAGFAAGGKGTGKSNGSKTVLDPSNFDNRRPVASNLSADDIVSQAYGTSQHPFSTTRVDYGVNLSRKTPYRRSGKLFFNNGSATFSCSASLIKRGIVVTAAHCVADFGTNTFYTNFKYIPAYKNGVAPFGVSAATSADVLQSYLDGSDLCAVPGVVCENDVAVITLAPQNGSYVGSQTGWFGYSWNGYGYNGIGVADGNMAQITQLGYPANHDGGEKMQRTDSYGVTVASQSNNTVIGSNFGLGASGGPWVVNIGRRAALTGIKYGRQSTPNRVVATTSWGYTDPAIKEQGASPFTNTNIVVLVDAACADTPLSCLP